MEIIEGDQLSRDGLVEIAFVDDWEEAAIVRGLLREDGIRSLAKRAALEGPSIGVGLLPHSPRRIYVRPEDAAPARALLSETMVEDPLEEQIPEPANAGYLADATGRKPRDYSALGAYIRGYLAAAIIFAVVVLVFILLH